MYYIVYLSTASRKYTSEELTRMAIHFKINNMQMGVTGMLLYNEGSFFQTIEGDEKVVNQLFNHISTDGRHHGIIKLKYGYAEERNFTEWTMSFNADQTKNGYKIAEPYVNPAERGILTGYGLYHPAVSLAQSFAVNNNLCF